MNPIFTGTAPDAAYEPIRRLLANFESRTEMVVNTCDCCYLEFRSAGQPRFFAAVERRAEGTVLRMQGLLKNPGIVHILSPRLQQCWDGCYSFVFSFAAHDMLQELDKLLELSLEQGYNQLGRAEA
ncbi:hypothetical protein [Taibaiella koreensis]|uniref:hypothetical protein n=1 Tax=Taibaiella koreensis TaxID=1268548 RepID=UPI000E599E8F|nr:hypothetical protein [Taibaiella koreensis]